MRERDPRASTRHHVCPRHHLNPTAQQVSRAYNGSIAGGPAPWALSRAEPVVYCTSRLERNVILDADEHAAQTVVRRNAGKIRHQRSGGSAIRGDRNSKTGSYPALAVCKSSEAILGAPRKLRRRRSFYSYASVGAGLHRGPAAAVPRLLLRLYRTPVACCALVAGYAGADHGRRRLRPGSPTPSLCVLAAALGRA